jgi:hypothetical protein
MDALYKTEECVYGDNSYAIAAEEYVIWVQIAGMVLTYVMVLHGIASSARITY